MGKLRVGKSLTTRASRGQHAVTVRQPNLVNAKSEPFLFDAAAGERIELVTQAPVISGAVKVWLLLRCIVIEGKRHEVLSGEETRSIDNSRSYASTTRVVRLTREWAKTYVLNVERAIAVRGSARSGIHGLTLKAEAEQTLKNTYSETSEERMVFEEVVTLNIAERTRSEIIFFWKEIRQEGIVRLSGKDFEVQIPYEVVVGLTFDQQQVDEVQVQPHADRVVIGSRVILVLQGVAFPFGPEILSPYATWEYSRIRPPSRSRR